jgi:hypothetical protein
LTSAPLPTAAGVVELLTCVQAQERDHALFSLGLCTRSATLASVRAELDSGAFLRTHILRPTWHFVRPADLRWILALTTPRLERSMRARHRELELDDQRYVGAAIDVVAELLAGGNHLTRTEIGALGHPRLPEPGPRLGHLLMIAELRGVICSGAGTGAAHTYALVDERVPATAEISGDEALARLAARFFAGHGPASAADLARWASLTVGDARRGAELAGDALERVEVDGTSLWFDPRVRPRRRPDAAAAWLLPTYDEVVLTYPALNFPAAEGHPHSAADDPFWARIVYGTTNVGMWKRTVAKDCVVVDARLAGSADAPVRKAVRAAAQRLADFVGRPLEYLEGSATPALWGGRPTARAGRAASRASIGRKEGVSRAAGRPRR